ncbi:MAG: hypothetical protein ABI425_04375 [Patescibacteria group bacterium]
MNMKKVFVPVDTQNIRLEQFTPIVLFLDQKIVLNEIQSVRNIIHLTEPVPYSEYSKYLQKISYELSQNEREQFEKMLERIDYLKQPVRVLTPEGKDEITSLEEEIVRWNDPLYTFGLIVKNVLKKWTIGGEFEEVLLKAIICNEVHEDDYIVGRTIGRAETICRDRERFWMNRRPAEVKKSYEEIARETQDVMRSVEQSVRSYETRLRKFKMAYYVESFTSHT